MKRPEPCFECGATESSMVHASDPWCSDVCHKAIAVICNIPQGELTVSLFREALRVFGQNFMSSPTPPALTYPEIMAHIEKNRKKVARG